MIQGVRKENVEEGGRKEGKKKERRERGKKGLKILPHFCSAYTLTIPWTDSTAELVASSKVSFFSFK